ncbi:MAG: hypothetical protein V4858_09080 [Pseudomonadota bacterium]
MWTDQQGRTVGDNETYTDSQGTVYPGWRKEDIPGLTHLPDPEPPPPPALSAEQIQKQVVFLTQMRLDNFAQTRGYDSMLSACTYATSGVPRFASDGQYAVTARDATWAALYTLMDEVQAGTKPMPTGFADVEPLLPALEWPT